MGHRQQLPLQVLFRGLQLLIKITHSTVSKHTYIIREKFNKYPACIRPREGGWKCNSENCFLQMLDHHCPEKKMFMLFLEEYF